jgi:hypothetical protein
MKITAATPQPNRHLMEPEGIGCNSWERHTLPFADGLITSDGAAVPEALIVHNGHAGLGGNASGVLGSFDQERATQPCSIEYPNLVLTEPALKRQART